MKKPAFGILIFSLFFLLAQACSPSLGSRVMYSSLKVVNFSERTFNEMLADPSRGKDHLSPSKIDNKLQVEVIEVEGFRVLTIMNSRPLSKHIVFLHGGAYVAEALKSHRYLIEKLAAKGCKVSFIDYPLAPEYDACFTMHIVEEAFRLITAGHPEDEFYLLGDSAGGGLALALLQVLRDKQCINLPQKSVLLSPWLDISMSNEEIPAFSKLDVLLDVKGLEACGKLYARGLDLKNPLVSPLFGNMENLAEIQVYVSTHELFYPDCLLLEQKLKQAPGSEPCLVIKEKLLHDWIMLPVKERKESIDMLLTFFEIG